MGLTSASGGLDLVSRLETSIDGVRHWVENHHFKGYDPADGNASFLHPLTCGMLFPQRVLQQLVLRAPWNIRPLLGVPRLESAPARGYMAAGYLKLYRLHGDPKCEEKARQCLDWLIENRSPFYNEYSWGNNFNYATRTGKRPRHEPIIVWTSLIGQAFLDAYELLEEDRYGVAARSACHWVMSLPRESTKLGDCLSYVAYKQVSIHNSNLLGAALLARAGAAFENRDFLDVAASAVEYSCARLRQDGAWFYGERPIHHWVDNFHTGYNLECLKRYVDCTGATSWNGHLERGLKFFKEHFFEASGAPKYYHDQTYPIDIQSASQAIETLVCLSECDPECLDLAARVAAWTVENMQDSDGHFYYRILSWKKVKTPMIHWGQATMFTALLSLYGKLLEKKERTVPAIA